MPFDVDRAAAYLAAEPGRPAAWPPGAPEIDYLRSPAAARVGALAADSGLFLFHFEHRAHQAIPEAFLPDGADPDAGAPPAWVDGRLPEAKYHSFRHDLLVGSFHPGHRGKWTTHELCHALVGFAWRPGATPLFHATAGRLAELLPVVLYYFLDEVRLRRCPDHDGGGLLYRAFCPACEAVAGPRPMRPGDRDALRDGRRYLDRELAAVARTRRTGRPYGYRFGSLDLCTDGLAYAAHHGRRLDSRAFHRFAERFLPDGRGSWRTLDDLEDRVVAVARAVCEGADLAPLAADPRAGRWAWAIQDLGWRMIVAALAVDGARRAEAEACIDALASAEPGPAAVEAARAAWPGDPDVFAVGYPLAGHGSDLGGLHEGLCTVCPLVMDLFDDAGMDPVPAFAAADHPVRRPLGDRFAAWLAGAHGPRVAALARFEVALRYAGRDPLSPILGAGEGMRDGRGARRLVERVDPVALSEAVASGEAQGVEQDGRLVLRRADGAPISEVPTTLWVSRGPDGEVAVVEPDGAVPAATLAALGMVDFARWPTCHGGCDVARPEGPR